MTNEKMTGREIVCIMVLFIFGSSLVTGGGVEAGQDAWISLIISIIMMIPVIMMYARLKKLAPNQDLFDIAYTTLGKIGGVIISIIFSLYSIHLGAMIIRNFTEFIQVVSIPETPQSINAICFGMIAYFTVKKGIKVLGRGVTLLLPIILVTLVLLTILSTDQMNIENIKPVLDQDMGKVLSGAFSTFTFPFAELVMFINLFPKVESKSSPTKLYLLGLLIAGIFLTVANIRNTLVLGVPVLESLYFPTYFVVSVINIKELITRVEVLVSAMFIVSGLVKVSVCLYVSCKGVAKIFNIGEYKKLAAPIALFMIALSDSAFKSTMDMVEFIKTYKYYSPIFQIIIPLVLLVFAEIRMRKIKPKQLQKG